ncbi:MAG: outer membrane protein [Parvibaculaceae bacterium]
MKRALLGVAAAVAIMTGPAFAADIVAPEPMAPSWSGLYLGVHGGWAWADLDAQYNNPETDEECFENDSEFPGGCAIDLKADGPFVGGQVGYNFVFDGGLMVGIEGDYAWMDLKDDDFGGNPEDNPPGPANSWETHVEQEIDQVASVRARLGFAMDNFLPFITGGWAWAHSERSAHGDFVDDSDKNWHDGWTIGGGFEYLISEDWSVKAEYRYYDFGKETYMVNEITDGTEVDFDMHTVQIGINFRLFQ